MECSLYDGLSILNIIYPPNEFPYTGYYVTILKIGSSICTWYW